VWRAGPDPLSYCAGYHHPQVINAGGVARMNRQLSVLQPGLAAAGFGGGQFRPEAVRAFERARTYYSLLTYSADSLVKVTDSRGRPSPTPSAVRCLGATSELPVDETTLSGATPFPFAVAV